MNPRKPDKLTLSWVRSASDETAIRNGCRFDEARGEHAVNWIEKYCKLYEGRWAGEPVILSDWALDCTMRIFSWVCFSEHLRKEIRRFAEASIWVAKKNKKSPTLAAWSWYILAGDGEPGQKVFLAAKDGNQVRQNLARHVSEMLLQSPELLEECTLNKVTGQIVHEPTRSVLSILSSSNKRTMEAKEGLNGSVMVDECHVVDREFIGRISRAGISREEPLRIEVSTAGNNPDSYGRERFNLAMEVIKGERIAQHVFAAVYAAPQDLSDANLAADPLKWGRMANPAMGHTVNPEEYLRDYESSKSSISALADFKMYRLNIWQQSSNPWLNSADWDACKRDFTLDDLEKMRCVAGLDLSKTRDMTALVLTFAAVADPDFTPEDGPYYLAPFFWLPEEAAKQYAHLAPFQTWAAQGYLTLTPGSVLPYGLVRGHFRKLAARYKITHIYYDMTYAEETTQALSEGVLDDEGNVIEEGTGVERMIFRQRVGDFANPTAVFERLVIAHKLWHNGHPVLKWQAGHVKVKSDANNNKRPMKPTQDDYRKIDGIVAGIMSLAGAMLADLGGSVYDSRPLEWI